MDLHSLHNQIFHNQDTIARYEKKLGKYNPSYQTYTNHVTVNIEVRDYDQVVIVVNELFAQYNVVQYQFGRKLIPPQSAIFRNIGKIILYTYTPSSYMSSFETAFVLVCFSTEQNLNFKVKFPLSGKFRRHFDIKIMKEVIKPPFNHDELCSILKGVSYEYQQQMVLCYSESSGEETIINNLFLR